MMLDVDGLTSWLDFYILFIPEVRLFYQVLAETKDLRDIPFILTSLRHIDL